jgi:hypothetical protein
MWGRANVGSDGTFTEFQAHWLCCPPFRTKRERMGHPQWNDFQGEQRWKGAPPACKLLQRKPSFNAVFNPWRQRALARCYLDLYSALARSKKIDSC